MSSLSRAISSKKLLFRRGLLSRKLYPMRSLSCDNKDGGGGGVVVVGGGVVGASTAYHLSKRGVKTTLLERDK